MSSLFGALVYGNIYLVIPWVTLVPQLISFDREAALDTTGTAIPRTLLMVLGISGAGVALMSGLRPPLDALLFLLLWASAEALKAAWGHVKRQRNSYSFQLGEVMVPGDQGLCTSLPDSVDQASV